MKSGRQTSKAGNMQKKANANLPNEVQLAENERRITLTLHVKPRLTENQTAESEVVNCPPPIQQQEQLKEQQELHSYDNDQLSSLFIKTNIIDAKSEQEFPGFVPNEVNNTSQQTSTKLASNSTPRKSSARRSASQTPKRHDVSNKETVNAQMENDISLQLWSWQDSINITSLRHLCDDKYCNAVQIIQRVPASIEEMTTSSTNTSSMLWEEVLINNAAVNTSNTKQFNDNKNGNYNQQGNEQNSKLKDTLKSKNTLQANTSKNIRHQQQQEKEQQQEEQESETLQKQKSSKQKNVSTKTIKGDKLTTSKNNSKFASNNINSTSSTLNNTSSKNEAEKVEIVDMVVAEMYIHLSDLLHRPMVKYKVKLESKHANWIESCWLELKCEKLSLLTEELIKLYRPVMVTVELSDFLRIINGNKEIYDESKEKESAKQISSQRQHNMWVRLRAFDQVKSHHVMVKAISHKLEKEHNIDNLNNSNKKTVETDETDSKRKYELVEQEWQTIFFLGDIPMLHVYQFLFFNKMTIELYVSEAFQSDTNTTKHTFNVNDSTLIGSACISLKEYLMLNHTLHEETVQLLPSERASHALLEYNMTSAATVGIAVNFYLPFPPITHVREGNTICSNNDNNTFLSNNNNYNSESNECTDAFLTRGVVIMPYADEWVSTVIKTFIEEVKKRPAVYGRHNGELYLYTPPSEEIDQTEEATIITKNASNGNSSSNNTSKTNTNAKLLQHSERLQGHRQEKDQTKEHERSSENKLKDIKNKKLQEKQQSEEMQHVSNTNKSSGKDNNKKNKNNNSSNTNSRNSSKVNRRNSRVSNEEQVITHTETENSTFAQPFQVVTPNMISGFEVMDGCCRVICIEGPVKEVQSILEAITKSANNNPALRVLFNSEIFIPHSEYGTFPPLVTLPLSEVINENESALHETHVNNSNDTNESQSSSVDLEHSDAEAGGTGGRIHRVRLSESISSICNHEKYWLHRILSNSCAECIRKLSALSSSPSCTTMREAVDNNLLPSSSEIIALERAFGQTLSNTDLYSLNNNDMSSNNKSVDHSALQHTQITDVENEREESGNSKAKSLESEVEEEESHQEMHLNWTDLCDSDVGKIVSFHGMIDSAKTRLVHKLLPSSLHARYEHIYYMNILNDRADSEGKSVKSTSSTTVKHVKNTVKKLSLHSKTYNNFLCGFVRDKPAESIAYRVDGQIVSYDSHVLLHVLSLECLTAKLTKTENTSYDKLLRQRHHEECYRTLHNTETTTTITTTTAAVKHRRKGEYATDLPITKEAESRFTECKISTKRKAENSIDKYNDKYDNDDDDNVWLVDNSWEFEEQARQSEFVREMQKKDEQRHTVRATQQSIKLAELHKQPTVAKKAAEYALWWKLYNARAPATEVKPAKHAVMRFEKGNYI